MMEPETTTQKPSVGRIVHFYREIPDDGRLKIASPLAAIISHVEEKAGGGELVWLFVFDAKGFPVMQIERNVEFRETLNGKRCWTWPPRV